MKKPSLRIAAVSMALLGFLAACGDNIVDPRLPPGAKAFTPPSFYSTWWEMTKACSGRSGSLSDVKWYVVPSGVQLELDGESANAYWSAGSNQIVLSELVVDDGQVVRHEMLHALLGKQGHSRRDFLEICAGYVACTSKCVEDAGPAPVVPANVPRVAPSALEVTMTISPNPLFGGVNAGYFTVLVRARNPAGTPVFVVLPGSSDPLPVSFVAQLLGPASELESTFVRDAAATSFAAGEVKVHAFDFFVDDDGDRRRHIFPGLYTVRGSYGGQRAPDQALQTH